jgi:hypothetical protein
VGSAWRNHIMAVTARKRSATSSERKAPAPSSLAVKAPGPTRREHYAAGKALRETCPRQAHAAWKPPADRRDAVELVLAAEKGRVEDLLPLRHGRMVKSAFTFYRGAALTMAADLAPMAQPTCATSAASPPRSGGSSSPSTTSMRRSRPRGNGTSSAWRRASSWPAVTTA